MNIKKLLGAGIVAGAVAFSSIGAAGAAVTFDPATGTGFVGKGDVQVPFGWNNKTLQDNALGVTFTYSETVKYAQDCQKTVGGSKQTTTIENTFKKTRSITAAVDADPRQQKKGQNQFTGFILSGYVDDEPGDLTAPTDLCTPGQGEGEEKNGWVQDVDAKRQGVYVTDAGSGGALTASHGIQSAVIWVPVPAAV